MKNVFLLAICMVFFFASKAQSNADEIQPATAYLYQPDIGVIADVIPYFLNGKFHLMHLQKKPGQKGFDWAQIVTRDFVDFEHTGVAIPGGGADDAVDKDIYTGSVFEKKGVLYAFYCGHNEAFKEQNKPDQLAARS